MNFSISIAERLAAFVDIIQSRHLQGTTERFLDKPSQPSALNEVVISMWQLALSAGSSWDMFKDRSTIQLLPVAAGRDPVENSTFEDPVVGADIVSLISVECQAEVSSNKVRNVGAGNWTQERAANNGKATRWLALWAS